MVKFPYLPAIGCMATCTVLSQAAFVPIILLMTAKTIFACILELLGQMTLLAGHHDM